jgi:hypothetical protein
MKLIGLLLLMLPALALPTASVAAEAPPPKEIEAGHYSGGGFPSTPVDFGVAASRASVKHFTTRLKLDCKQGGSWVGELVVKRAVFTSIPIVKTADGGRFNRNAVFHYRGGGKLRLTLRGTLLAPDRAKGVLTAHAHLPGGISCKPFFGPIRWTARHAGS